MRDRTDGERAPRSKEEGQSFGSRTACHEDIRAQGGQRIPDRPNVGQVSVSGAA